MTPHLLPIKLAAGAVLCVFLFVGGCRYGTGKAEAQRVTLQARIMSLETSLTDFIATFDRVNSVAKQAQADADAQRQRANDAVQQAKRERAQYQTRLELIQSDLDKAKRDPKCAEQLREPVCVVIY